jgi:hypothetical protein
MHLQAAKFINIHYGPESVAECTAGHLRSKDDRLTMKAPSVSSPLIRRRSHHRKRQWTASIAKSETRTQLHYLAESTLSDAR